MSNPTGHITTGEHETKFGFEKWTFLITLTAVQSAIEKGERMNDPGYIKELPQRFWMQRDNIPSRSDISELHLGKVDDQGRIEITVIIKRGHLVLSQILHDHHCTVESLPDVVRVYCHCHDKKWTLPLSSFPKKEK